MNRAPLVVLCLLLVACGGDPAEAPADAADSAASDQAPGDPAPAVAPVALELPPIAPDQHEWHGRWRGEPFWARLSPMHPTYGGRVLKVVYTQPTIEALGGAHLDPHPWLLLDEDLALRFWNERSRLSRAEYRVDDDPAGYRVTREVERMVGDEAFADEDDLSLAGAPGWDRRMAPLLLALVWRADTVGAVPLYDFFADGARSNLRWDGIEVTVDGETWQVQATADGRLGALLDHEREPILEVEAYLPLLPAEEALAREDAFLEDLGAR